MSDEAAQFHHLAVPLVEAPHDAVQTGDGEVAFEQERLKVNNSNPTTHVNVPSSGLNMCSSRSPLTHSYVSSRENLCHLETIALSGRVSQ
jgi:hypothetical protein